MIPKQLSNEIGIKYLLVKSKSKNPIELNWQKKNNYDSNSQKLLQHLEAGGNYGVLCGNGLIVMDADTDVFNEIIKANFPETFTIETKGGKHYYYFCKDFKQKKVLKDGDEHLGEIQSTGTFVVGAGSIHPSGKKYSITNNVDIQELDIEFIDKILMKYYVSQGVKKDVIISGASEGLRNETMFKIACSFREKGLDVQETLLALSGINEKNNPPLNKNELNTVVKSAFSYQKNKSNANVQKSALKITNYIQNVEQFWKIHPFFYDKAKIFWTWNVELNKYELVDDIDVMNSIDDELGFGGDTVTSTVKYNYLESFKRIGRKKHPKEAPIKWLQFKDKAFSLKSGKIYQAMPNYFFTNPIPWEIGETSDTPVMDKLFKEWVGEDYVNTLYEILAYCCYRDYPIQVLFCLYGIGRNGKSCFLKVLSNFLGKDNLCSTDLDLLMGNNRSRFESFKLYKKLICLMGETNFGVLSNSAMLKKLTGGDMIGYEVKNGKAFDDYSYAKLIIASNSLPTSEDTSEGFYRRWIIINFPNKFPEGKDIVKTIPDIEYSNLAKKICNILPGLLKRGIFINQGDIKERKKKYILASNPLCVFIKEECEESTFGYLRYSEMYTRYVQYLNKVNKRIVSKREFSKFLDIEGLEVRRTTKDSVCDRYVEGLMWISEIIKEEKIENN